jgi:hypothetical protein
VSEVKIELREGTRPQTLTILARKCRSSLKKDGINTPVRLPRILGVIGGLGNAQSRISDLIVKAIGYHPMINAAMLTSITCSLNVHIGNACPSGECGEAVRWFVQK